MTLIFILLITFYLLIAVGVWLMSGGELKYPRMPEREREVWLICYRSFGLLWPLAALRWVKYWMAEVEKGINR